MHRQLVPALRTLSPPGQGVPPPQGARRRWRRRAGQLPVLVHGLSPTSAPYDRRTRPPLRSARRRRSDRDGLLHRLIDPTVPDEPRRVPDAVDGPAPVSECPTALTVPEPHFRFFFFSFHL